MSSNVESCQCTAATRLLVVQHQIEVFKTLTVINPSLSATEILQYLGMLVDDGSQSTADTSDDSAIGSGVVLMKIDKYEEGSLTLDPCEKGLPKFHDFEPTAAITNNDSAVVDGNHGVGTRNFVRSVTNTRTNDDTVIDHFDSNEGVGVFSSVRSEAAIGLNGTGRRAFDEFIAEERDKKDRTWFRCLKCEKRMTLKYNTRLHVMRVHYKQRFQCSKCLRKFYTTTDLRAHERTTCIRPSSGKNSRGHKWVTPDGGQRQKPSKVLEKVKVSSRNGPHQQWKCTVCQKIMTSKQGATLHVRRVHWQERLECPKCKGTFYDHHTLNVHEIKCTMTNSMGTNDETEFNSNQDGADEEEGRNNFVDVMDSFPNINLEQAMNATVSVGKLTTVETFEYFMDTGINKEEDQDEDFKVKISNVVGADGISASFFD